MNLKIIPRVVKPFQVGFVFLYICATTCDLEKSTVDKISTDKCVRRYLCNIAELLVVYISAIC